VKIGVIGSGSRGTNDARILAKDPRARIVAVADIVDAQMDAAKAKIPAPDAKTYRNYKDLLASDVDAVVIATPVFLHPDHLEAAIKAGKHIYIEKPAGVDVAGCKRVMKLADGADRKLNLTFGFQQRYGGVYVKAKQMLDSGAIGKIREVHGEFIKFALKGDEPVPPPPRTDHTSSSQVKKREGAAVEIYTEGD
jgi:predicted dehydrogenase